MEIIAWYHRTDRRKTVNPFEDNPPRGVARIKVDVDVSKVPLRKQLGSLERSARRHAPRGYSFTRLTYQT